MPALLSFETALAGPAPACLMSPLIERDDDPEVYIEAMCLADELMHNAQGLMNPNGFIKTFRNQVVEVAERLPPNFVPNFPDLRTAGARLQFSWAQAMQSSMRSSLVTLYIRSWPGSFHSCSPRLQSLQILSVNSDRVAVLLRSFSKSLRRNCAPSRSAFLIANLTTAKLFGAMGTTMSVPVNGRLGVRVAHPSKTR